MIKELIDAGKSRRGWSRLGQFTKCPQLFAYTNRLGLELVPAAALTRGSMGHILQAHLHAIWGAEQGGVLVDTSYYTDPDIFLDPREAIVTWCDINNAGHEYIERMLTVFDNYIETYPEPPGRVLAVEWPMTAVIGRRLGEWGLWVIDPNAEHLLDGPCETILAHDGVEIEVTPLNAPGHPEHGHPINVTRRCDAVIEERGRVFIWDHKHQARVSKGRSIDAYAIDGGFALFRHMGKQVFGDQFVGLRLNLIQTTEPYNVARPTVPPTPHRDRHLAQLVWDAEHQIALYDVRQPDLWTWPKSMHETTCIGRYGSCAGLKLCFYGEAGKRYLETT